MMAEEEKGGCIYELFNTMLVCKLRTSI